MIQGLEDLQHHEAAHYAMAALLGLEVVEVAALPGRGHVLHWFHPSSRSDATKTVMVILSGLLEQLDWRELVWGRLDLQRSDDERQVLDLIERWNVPENVYERLLDATVELRTSAEFDRLKRHALVALAWQPVVHGGLLEELAA